MTPTPVRRAGLRVGLVVGGLVASLLLLEGTLQLAALFVPSPSDGWRSTERGGDGPTVRVLCLGESTTHGFGETPYPTLLREALDEQLLGVSFEVINAGVPGTHSPYLASRAGELIDQHSPDVVIAMMGINDEVYFTDVEILDRFPSWQVALLRSRVYRLFRLLWTNVDRRLEASSLASKDVDRAHLRRYRAEYEEANKGWASDRRGEGGLALEALIATARDAGVPQSDGTLSIPEPYWHIYEISHSRLTTWLVDHERVEEAEALLRRAIELHPRNLRFRRRLVWLLGHTGQDDARDRERDALDRLEGRQALRVTAASWQALREVTARSGVALVALQYPLRDVESLRRMLGGAADVTFVENVDNFRSALSSHGYDGVFVDRFAGDFGHSTEIGNRLIADRLVEQVFRPRYGVDGFD